VSLADLQPGDLVFFKNTYRRGISHVGVYAGRNKFIHASNSRLGVTVTPLSDPYYQLHYAGARRLF
jgi:cell wall-associated NlpC family hydrolase